jgi:hypothetical protein
MEAGHERKLMALVHIHDHRVDDLFWVPWCTVLSCKAALDLSSPSGPDERDYSRPGKRRRRELGCYAWGDTRYDVGNQVTSFRSTGQRCDSYTQEIGQGDA